MVRPDTSKNSIELLSELSHNVHITVTNQQYLVSMLELITQKVYEDRNMIIGVTLSTVRAKINPFINQQEFKIIKEKLKDYSLPLNSESMLTQIKYMYNKNILRTPNKMVNLLYSVVIDIYGAVFTNYVITDKIITELCLEAKTRSTYNTLLDRLEAYQENKGIPLEYIKIKVSEKLDKLYPTIDIMLYTVGANLLNRTNKKISKKNKERLEEEITNYWVLQGTPKIDILNAWNKFNGEWDKVGQE